VRLEVLGQLKNSTSSGLEHATCLTMTAVNGLLVRVELVTFTAIRSHQINSEINLVMEQQMLQGSYQVCSPDLRHLLLNF
jgi:hypothetical protein